MNPEREHAPPKWGASDNLTIATQRISQTRPTASSANHQILARAGALATACTAMATGVSDFEPTPLMIEAAA